MAVKLIPNHTPPSYLDRSYKRHCEKLQHCKMPHDMAPDRQSTMKFEKYHKTAGVGTETGGNIQFQSPTRFALRLGCIEQGKTSPTIPHYATTSNLHDRGRPSQSLNLHHSSSTTTSWKNRSSYQGVNLISFSWSALQVRHSVPLQLPTISQYVSYTSFEFQQGTKGLSIYPKWHIKSFTPRPPQYCHPLTQVPTSDSMGNHDTHCEFLEQCSGTYSSKSLTNHPITVFPDVLDNQERKQVTKFMQLIQPAGSINSTSVLFASIGMKNHATGEDRMEGKNTGK